MLNKTMLLGRLAQNPEIRSTAAGTPVASFDLAVSVLSKDNDAPPYYIPIVCWSKQAEFAQRFLTKGRQIVVEGRITTRKYQDSDGKNRKAVEVTAERLYFADSGRKEAANNQNGAPAGDPSGAFYGYPEIPMDDEDLPF